MPRFSGFDKQSRYPGFLIGLGLAMLIFLAVPLTQILEPKHPTIETIEELQLAAPPPPPPLDEPPPPPPKKEDEPPPQLEVPPPMPSLEQLEVSLNPGTGDLSIGLGLNINFETESVDQIGALFGFDELDEVPRLLREGRFRYPANAPRGRGQAFVRLLIYLDTDGRVSVQEVVEYSHREFIEAAKALARGSRFSPPMRHGQAVRSRYEWPIRIPLK